MSEIQGLVAVLDSDGNMISEIGYRISGDALSPALLLNGELESELRAGISRIIAQEPGNLRAGAVLHCTL